MARLKGWESFGWTVLAVDSRQQDGALPQPRQRSHPFSCPSSPAQSCCRDSLDSARGPHGDSLLAWLGAGAAESRVHRRVLTCSVEPLPLSRPLPNHLLPPQPLWILCPPPPHASPCFQVGTGHSQDLLSTGDFRIIFVGRFSLLLNVVWPLKTALKDRDPSSISAPSLPSFMSLGILALLRIYFLGIRDKYLPLKATVEIK